MATTPTTTPTMTSTYPQQPPSPHDLVPHYGPNGTPNRGDPYYYHNYGFSPSVPPPHPDRSVAPSAWDSSVAASAVPNANLAFASPPTWPDVAMDLGPSPPQAQAPPPAATMDLLDDAAPIPSMIVTPTTPVAFTTTTAKDLQTATLLAAQEQSHWDSTTAPRSIAVSDDIPAEIVASQERALAQAKQQQQQQTALSPTNFGYNGNHQLANTTSTALMVPLSVPKSNNPMGSDAVHPARQRWKDTRGTKTAAGAASGAILGGVAFGPAFPIGMILGGAAGGYAANKISKTGERRAQRKWEQASYQQGVAQSPALSHEALLV